MKNKLMVIFSLFLLFISNGCVNRGTLNKGKTEDTTVVVSRGEAPPSPAALPDKPVATIEGEKSSYEKFTRPARRFDLALKNADLREVLFSLAKEDDFQLIIEPGVGGTVNLDMKDVTSREVIGEICRVNRLYCRNEKDVIRVGNRKLITRMYYLDYILTIRQGSGNLTATTSASSSGESTTGQTTSVGGGSGGEETESTNTVTTGERMDIWATLGDTVSAFLSGEEAKLVITPESGMISVTDYPENQEMVEKYLSTIEERLKSQVHIEAKIIEVDLNESNEYGIDWSAVIDLSGIGFSGTLAGGATLSQGLSSGATAFQFGVADSRVDFLLDAIAEQGQLNVLSSPRISTLNNQKAIIKIGTQDVFFRAIVTPASNNQAAFTTFSPETITEGIILSVTPQVGRDGRITLAVHPSISEKTGEAVAPDGNTAPIVDVRETNTIISVNDGETVFIGGLMQDRTFERVTSVPFLGDIPFLGALFRNTVQEKRKAELVILLTPSIVRANNLRAIAEEEARRITTSRRGFHLGARPWLYGTEGEKRITW